MTHAKVQPYITNQNDMIGQNESPNRTMNIDLQPIDKLRAAVATADDPTVATIGEYLSNLLSETLKGKTPEDIVDAVHYGGF